MPIYQWPVDDRPREKLLDKGAKALTEAELIALLLETGIRGKSALDIARDLLIEHGGLRQIFNTPCHTMIKKLGLGPAKYARMLAAAELGKRIVQEVKTPGLQLSTSSVSKQFLQQNLQDHTQEVFACAFLDTQYRLLAFEQMFHGTINEAAVYPREIVKRGLFHNAAKVILGHNHPSGEAKASEADIQMTGIIQQSLHLVDIIVVDHIVVGAEANFSFADHGLL